MPGFEKPFTNWVRQKFGLSGDENEDTSDDMGFEYLTDLQANPPEDPLSDSGVALNYYRDQALKDAGWSDPSRAWAKRQVPISGRRDMPLYGVAGSYYPGTHQVEMSIKPWATPDAEYSQTVEHEMQHASDDYIGGPGPDDFDAVLNKDLRNPGAWLKGLNPTWGGRGKIDTRGTSAPDDAHYTQRLFDMGYGADDLPDWYREAFLPQYKR
jgi:hypothetical protein